MRAQSTPDGYRFSGEAPWVTGWGLIDVLHVAARDENDTIVWALLPALPSSTLAVEPLEMLAVTSSRTVTLRFDDHPVPAGAVTGTLPYAEWPARDAAGLRLNGSLALGLSERCRLLLTDGTLAAAIARDIDAARSALDAAATEYLPAARAAASDLALRATATLMTAVGARGILAGGTAQRLFREAGFLLVFGSRPPIRADLLRRLARTP
jgi:alkylation response protein AidB-like acyl-CoA dehydrogenase